MKKMKKLLIITLVIMVGVFSQGCGGSDDYDDEVVSNDEEYEEEYEEEEEEYEEEEEEGGSVEVEGFRRVGSVEAGYMSIPSDWINLNTVNPNAIETQYCNEEQTFVVALFRNEDAGIDAETTAELLAQQKMDDGHEYVQVGAGEIAGYPAAQVMTEYDTGFAELIWCFETGEAEGEVNVIIAQALADELQELIDLIVESYGVYE